MLKGILVGNLGGDPDMRYSASGKPLLRFNVASNYRVPTPEGDWQDRTEWVRVTVVGSRAESIGQYLSKGSRVYVDGRLEARPWVDQQGQMRAGLEILADDIQFMSSAQPDQQARQPQQQAQQSSRRPSGPVAPEQADDELEDLPF